MAEQYEGPEEFPGTNGELMEGVGNGHQTFSGAGFGTLMLLASGYRATFNTPSRWWLKSSSAS